MGGVCHKIYRINVFVFQMMLIQMNFSWLIIVQKFVFLKKLMCITQYKSKKKIPLMSSKRKSKHCWFHWTNEFQYTERLKNKFLVPYEYNTFAHIRK